MARQLINVFRVHYKYYGDNDWYRVISDFYILDLITERFGDKFYNKTIEHLVSIDDIGAAITPFLAVMVQLNFSMCADTTLFPEPDEKTAVAILCEKITLENYEKIMALNEIYNIALVGSLVHLDEHYELPMRHVYLYDSQKLDD